MIILCVCVCVCSTWQSVQGAIPDALDAFESALGSLMELELVQKIWME